jgi:N,N'-diacetyllegionaminate synthase
MIGGRPVGAGHPCLIVAEVAQAHDGSLGTAHAYIDAAARAGADAVKFQTHLAAAESTPGEPWRVRFSPQDSTRYDYWKRMEFSDEQWYGLARHARERGLLFLSSPFSLDAVELLLKAEVPAWKVASGEVGNRPFLERLGHTGLPVILSSGMSPLAEVDAAVALLRRCEAEVVVLQCTSAYPCPPEKIGLNLLEEYRTRYDCPVGLSDHSGTIYPGLAGAAVGMDMLEVHLVLSRELFGPDVPASVTSEELRQLVDGVRFIERMRAHPIAKDEMARETAPLRALFTKSVVANVDLPAGTVLTAEVLAVKKPGTGIPAERFHEVVGRRLRRAVAADELLRDEDFETGGPR